MQGKAVVRICMVVAVILSLGVMFGCAGREFAPKDPYPYWYYPKELPEADRAVDQARAAGKDKECPDAFNAVKDEKDRAYEIYAACRDNEAIAMAREAAAKAKELCPPKAAAVKPRAEEAKAEALEDIHFKFDKATLTKKAKMILKKNAQILKASPDTKIRIEGNACQHGSEQYNQRLSMRRAEAVRRFLIKEGISSERLSVVAYGKTKPLFEQKPTPKNKNSKEMKANRRVHFEIMD